jgi:hypothetical protein
MTQEQGVAYLSLGLCKGNFAASGRSIGILLNFVQLFAKPLNRGFV